MWDHWKENSGSMVAKNLSGQATKTDGIICTVSAGMESSKRWSLKEVMIWWVLPPLMKQAGMFIFMQPRVMQHNVIYTEPNWMEVLKQNAYHRLTKMAHILTLYRLPENLHNIRSRIIIHHLRENGFHCPIILHWMDIKFFMQLKQLTLQNRM